MGANTIAISHFIDFRMRIDYSQRVGQYILKYKCTKKRVLMQQFVGKYFVKNANNVAVS